MLGVDQKKTWSSMRVGRRDRIGTSGEKVVHIGHPMEGVHYVFFYFILNSNSTIYTNLVIYNVMSQPPTHYPDATQSSIHSLNTHNPLHSYVPVGHHHPHPLHCHVTAEHQHLDPLIAYIKRRLYSCQQKVGVCFNYFWFSMMGVSMEHNVTMFHQDSGSMLIESLEMFRSSFFGREAILL